jgi:hypothetical protein
METESESLIQTAPPPVERLAYSIEESAKMLGVNYHSIYPATLGTL